MLSATSFSVPLEDARSKFAVNMLVVMLHSSLPTMSHGQVSSSLEIISGIDDLFGVDMTGVDREHFQTINALASYVEEHVEQ